MRGDTITIARRRWGPIASNYRRRLTGYFYPIEDHIAASFDSDDAVPGVSILE
jgi:hypothetical protein